MGLLSNVPKIDCIHPSKLKNKRGYVAKRVVAIGNVVVVLLEDGRIWTNWQTFQKFAMCPGGWGERVDDLLACLVALGLITKAEMDQHMDMERRRSAEKDRASDVEQLERLAKRLGYTVKKPKGAK